MSQVDPKTLDYSDEMKSYFQDVVEMLTRRFGKSPGEARDLISLYFSIDVDPLERAVLMHTAPETVAADLARNTKPIASRIKPGKRSQLAAG